MSDHAGVNYTRIAAAHSALIAEGLPVTVNALQEKAGVTSATAATWLLGFFSQRSRPAPDSNFHDQLVAPREAADDPEVQHLIDELAHTHAEKVILLEQLEAAQQHLQTAKRTMAEMWDQTKEEQSRLQILLEAQTTRLMQAEAKASQFEIELHSQVKSTSLEPD